MTVVVNGEPRPVPDESTVATLLRLLDAPRDGVAVAVNGEVVPRTRHDERRLADDDRVEVIRAVGGG